MITREAHAPDELLERSFPLLSRPHGALASVALDTWCVPPLELAEVL